MDLYAELRELVRALDDAQVDYALCGGLANISVVSRRALIALKLSAGRPQDLVDVQNLEALGDD